MRNTGILDIMKLSPLLLAVRAISVEFAKRIYYPVSINGAAVLFVLVAGSVWLVTESAWWLFLLVPLILIFLVFSTVSIIAGLALRLIQPSVTAQQKKDIKHFVDSLQKLAETIGTPKFVLLFRLTKDVVFPNKTGLVGELASHTTSLKPDFDAIVDSFR